MKMPRIAALEIVLVLRSRSRRPTRASKSKREGKRKSERAKEERK